MQRKEKWEAGDLSTGLTTVKDDDSKKSNLINHEKIEGTPFTITGNEETGYFVRMGDYKLTEAVRTMEEAAEQLLTEDWNIIVNMICVIMDMAEKTKLQTTQNKPNE